MSLTPGQVWRGAPAVGEDTTEIMEKLLGFSHHAIQEYYSGGITHRTEPCTQPVCDPLQV